jgi:hypothetical protein
MGNSNQTVSDDEPETAAGSPETIAPSNLKNPVKFHAQVYSVSVGANQQCRMQSIAWDDTHIEVRFDIHGGAEKVLLHPSGATLNAREPTQVILDSGDEAYPVESYSGALLFDVQDFKEGEELTFQYGIGFSNVKLLTAFRTQISGSPVHRHLFMSMFSIYNKQYQCQIFGVEWDGQEIKVNFEVRGDYSLWDLQHPKSSTLNRQQPIRVELSKADSKSCYAGVLVYSASKFSIGKSLKFQYGYDGYSKVNLGIKFRTLQSSTAPTSNTASKEAASSDYTPGEE